MTPLVIAILEKKMLDTEHILSSKKSYEIFIRFSDAKEVQYKKYEILQVP
jgi:hypothetical protein